MAATMSMFTTSALRATTLRPRQSQSARRAAVVVRASNQEETPAQAPSEGVFFYKGKTYTQEEWQKAVADGSVNQAAPTPAEYTNAAVADNGDGTLSIAQLMAFSGPAPELINGRLAMLAFVSALGAELASGEGVLRQLADEPTGVVLAAIAFATASLIPLLSSTKREAFGPFTPGAEMLNGRAAMIGFAALLVAEAVRGGSALF